MLREYDQKSIIFQGNIARPSETNIYIILEAQQLNWKLVINEIVLYTILTSNPQGVTWQYVWRSKTFTSYY